MKVKIKPSGVIRLEPENDKDHEGLEILFAQKRFIGFARDESYRLIYLDVTPQQHRSAQ